MNAVESIVECVRHGGTLQIKDGSLDLARPASFPAGVVDELKANKPAILEILSRRVMIVRSKLDPDHPMFWCMDDDARDLLIRNGAPPGSVWVRAELAEIVEADPDRDAMSLIIASKRDFGAQVNTNPGAQRAIQPEEEES